MISWVQLVMIDDGDQFSSGLVKYGSPTFLVAKSTQKCDITLEKSVISEEHRGELSERKNKYTINSSFFATCA